MTSIVLMAVLAAKPSVGVLYFDNHTGKGDYDVLRKGLADMIVTDLVAWDGVAVVEREKLEAVLGELKLQQTKAFDAASTAKVGKVLGATYLLTGSLVMAGSELSLEAKLITTQDSTVALATRVKGNPDSI